MPAPPRAEGTVPASARRKPNTVEQSMLNEVQVRLITPDEQARFDALLCAKHYLRSAFMVGEQLRYVAVRGEQSLALLSWCALAAGASAAQGTWLANKFAPTRGFGGKSGAVIRGSIRTGRRTPRSPKPRSTQRRAAISWSFRTPSAWATKPASPAPPTAHAPNRAKLSPAFPPVTKSG